MVWSAGIEGEVSQSQNPLGYVIPFIPARNMKLGDVSMVHIVTELQAAHIPEIQALLTGGLSWLTAMLS